MRLELLSNLRQQVMAVFVQVGGKILYHTSNVQRTIMSGFKEAYRLKDT